MREFTVIKRTHLPDSHGEDASVILVIEYSLQHHVLILDVTIGEQEDVSCGAL